jgi:predicted nuclease of restriction endonuclease-like (RecB) superfamily
LADLPATRTKKLLFQDVTRLIEESRSFVATTINATLTMLYWKIGARINDEILNNKRAGYGKQIVATLSQQLERLHGKGFNHSALSRMIKFAELFPDESVIASAMRQLSWSHFTLLIPIRDPLQREFYAEMCRIERWSVRVLREKIDGMLYERTALSKKPANLIKKEIKKLRDKDLLSPDLVFRNPYILNFLRLKDTYNEKDLEVAILREMESFILELGQGFAFVERQKKMIIDGEEYKLDLLFYHRKLKRLIAIELKLGRFKAAFKSQMELYLRWLEKHELHSDEKNPLGLILCTEGNKEQIELLQLDKAGIKVSQYLTALPQKDLLRRKLIEVIKLQSK